MNIQLKPLEEYELDLFRPEMIGAFQQGVLDRFGSLDAAPIPSASDIDNAWQDAACNLFIITADGTPAGGTIIRYAGNKKYSLDLLFIFKEFRNRKIGTAAWQAIEQYFHDAEIWETCTPYFDRRNIHFYLNKCHFKIVDFFNEFHKEEHDLTDQFKDINTSGFFRFEKVLKQ